MNKKKLALAVILIFVCSCKKKSDSHEAEKIEAIRTHPVKEKCGIQFSRGLSLLEIAKVAHQMKSECHLSEEDMLESAKKIF